MPRLPRTQNPLQSRTPKVAPIVRDFAGDFSTPPQRVDRAPMRSSIQWLMEQEKDACLDELDGDGELDDAAVGSASNSASGRTASALERARNLRV